ncbi:MAG: methionyl-tRNA formyltransferase, partial [Gemmatimonadales bacterium]
MRLVFFGTPEFAVPSLAALHHAQFDIAAVVTQPDRPRGRSRSTVVAPPVKVIAEQLHLPVWQPERPRGGEFLDRIRAARADLAVVVAYGHLLPAELLAIPRLGFVNVHASLLPRWRGAAPIQWAILSGDAETGVTIMRIEAGLDTGAVWLERRAPIAPADTAGSLAARLAALGAEALLDALPRIAAGEAPAPQDEATAAHAAKVTRDLARVDWRQPAREIARLIRALDPAPGAWTTLRGEAVKLFAPAAPSHASFAQSGHAIWRNGELLIAAGNGAVSVGTVQPAGRRRMAAVEWVRGTALDGLR